MSSSGKHGIAGGKERDEYQAVMFIQTMDFMPQEQVDMIAQEQVQQSQMITDFDIDGARRVGCAVMQGDRLQHMLPPGVAGSHSQGLGCSLAQDGESSEGVIVDPLHHAGLGQQQLAGCRQRHTASLSDEQGRAQTLFQFLHVVGQRWLAQPHVPGGETHAFVGRDFNELSEMFVHGK